MKTLTLALLIGSSGIACAELKLARLFSDHAVLQQDMGVPVWGWATAGAKVQATLAGQSAEATAEKSGRWMLRFSSLKAGGPHELVVKGDGGSVTVKDVLIGEVWLGSGQSNIAMTVSRANDPEAEARAAGYPQIRMFTVGGGAAKDPAADCSGKWVVCSPETVGGFSATAYFFGREVHRTLKVPVGLINSSVGGTPIEAWVEASAQEAMPELAPLLKQVRSGFIDVAAAMADYEKEKAAWAVKAKAARAAGKPAPRAPRDPVALHERKKDIGGLFNGKIAPLVPYAVRGFLWYQGEANSVMERAPYYRHLLGLLVQDWRKRWGAETAPFAWVQLPNFESRGEGWCLVREAMFENLCLPNTGMAVTIDIGDPKDVHPRNKQEVGRRLAQWALGSVYGQEVAVSGPRYLKHEIIGPHVVVKMSHTDGGLVGKHELKGFVICGEDRKWQAAEVKIDGSKLFISSPAVPRPVAVRYAWAEVPVVSLWNGAGLPASPFRTDRFPVQSDEEVRRAVLAGSKKPQDSRKP